MRRCGLLLAVAVVGCAPPSSEPSPPSVRDSLGVRIVENGDADALPVSRVGPEPIWRVGQSEQGPYLQRVSGGALLGGEAAFADREGAQVYLVDSDGDVRSIGRRGEGPGEFQSPRSVVGLPDSRLGVWDDRSRRLSIFSRDGELLGSRRFSLPGASGLVPGGALADARLGWLPDLESVFLPPGDEDPTWLERPLVTTDLEMSEADTVENVRVLYVEQNSNPFIHVGTGSTHRQGFVWATTDTPEARWIGVDGATRVIARWRQTPVDVDDQMWAEYELLHRARLSSRGIEPPEESLAESLRAQREDAPRSLPYFRWLRSTPDGAVWLSEYSMASSFPRRFLVLSAGGFMERWVEFPRPIQVLDVARDRVLGVEEDEWGVQTVVVYAIGPTMGTRGS